MRWAELGLLAKPEHAAAAQAARLAKADLTTQMVREFPELQGVMGGIYLRTAPRVGRRRRSRWHYHADLDRAGRPRRHGELARRARPPRFAAVSLADKLDTLAGYFGARPRAHRQRDPFGLRRAAQGACACCSISGAPTLAAPRPSLRALDAVAVAGSRALKRPAADGERPQAFLLDGSIRAGGGGFRRTRSSRRCREPDALDDPHESWCDSAPCTACAEASEDFAPLAIAFKRAKNILLRRQSAAPAVRPAVRAGRRTRRCTTAVAALEPGRRATRSATRASPACAGRSATFFDDVMVMAEDPKLRANRLGLLQ